MLEQFIELVNLEENHTTKEFGYSSLLKEMMVQKSQLLKADFDAYVFHLTCPNPK